MKDMAMSSLAKRAVFDAFVKLKPREQAKNPVMLMVYISAILTLALFVLSLFGIADAQPGFIIAVSVVLWLTVLFANFAEAIAEGRGAAAACDRDLMGESALPIPVTPRSAPLSV